MTILWDWNGTLIDDVALSLALENQLFPQYGYRKVALEEYLAKFCMPVQHYYEKIGVSGEDFYAIAGKWADLYQEASIGCELHQAAVRAVALFHQVGFRQVILSATEKEFLRRQVARYPQLSHAFDDIAGVDDVFARGKVDMALRYLEANRLDVKQTVFLGDTLHDAEVAEAIGCRCILIASGHQSAAVLEQAGVPVVADALAAAAILGLEDVGGEKS